MFEYSKSSMFHVGYANQPNYYRPPVDVIETATGFVVRIEIAGMNEKDFEVKFDQNTLTIYGIRRDPIRNQVFHQMEIHFGEFRIEIKINQPIQAEAMKAEYQNGFLSINLIKAIPQEIPITDKDA